VHIKFEEHFIVPPHEVFVLKTFAVKIFNCINPVVKKEASPCSQQLKIIGDSKRTRSVVEDMRTRPVVENMRTRPVVEDIDDEQHISSSSSRSSSSSSTSTPCGILNLTPVKKSKK